MTASLLCWLPATRRLRPKRPGGDAEEVAAAVAVHLGIAFIWTTDSRMSHTLGISDGCLQLGEADLGIPQLGNSPAWTGCGMGRQYSDTDRMQPSTDVAVHVVQAPQLARL
jgi:hypothetical protein